VVQFLLKRDKKEIFIFAPLQGKTAAEKLKQLPDSIKNLDSIILIEDFGLPQEKISVLGQGAFRILWLLGGIWACVGWMSFLPPFLYDWGYRFIAKNRQRFFRQDICVIPDPLMKDRFLP
jgi:predicted DCC family thiol-disulfide oxidoreductase YuxK